MPKRVFIPVKLAEEQYDRCADCPLCGLIPEKKRKDGKRKKYVCLGVFPHKALTSKGIWVRASNKDSKHKLHRPCDLVWAAWMTLPKHMYSMLLQDYTEYRLPFEQTLQQRIDFD